MTENELERQLYKYGFTRASDSMIGMSDVLHLRITPDTEVWVDLEGSVTMVRKEMKS